jgi:Na+/phosphate symporter
MLNLSFERFEKRDTIIEKKLLDRESAVDSITEDIIRYLTKISQKTLGMRLSNQLTNLLHVAYDIERTGDHAESILYLIRVKEENNMTFSKAELYELQKAFEQVKYMFKTLTIGIEDDSVNKLKQCESIENKIDEIVKEARTNHLVRLRNEECAPHSGVVFADIILHLERIGDLLYAVSRNLLDIKHFTV